jgi:hypothetical protein
VLGAFVKAIDCPSTKIITHALQGGAPAMEPGAAIHVVSCSRRSGSMNYGLSEGR